MRVMGILGAAVVGLTAVGASAQPAGAPKDGPGGGFMLERAGRALNLTADQKVAFQKAFEARVARSLLRGLYLRFGADPTVGGMAMIAFRDGVTAVFPAADATAILA